jgi:hypothetical protein
LRRCVLARPGGAPRDGTMSRTKPDRGDACRHACGGS